MKFNTHKIKIVTLLLVILTEVETIFQWLRVKEFQSFFLFSNRDLDLIIFDSIHKDNGTPLLLTRIIHNKLDYVLLYIYKNYLEFFNPSYLIFLLSLVGMIGFFFGLYFLFTSSYNTNKKAVLLIVLVMPFVEIFFSKFLVFKVFFIPYIIMQMSISIYGIWKYLGTSNRRIVILFILILLSILMQLCFGVIPNEFTVS